MENYGETLKKIRESLNMSQQNISKGIMSQSNYSKVEHGEIDIPFTKMVGLLNQLGMSIDEFLYIHRDFAKNPGKQLSRLNRLKPGDQLKINQNIDELKAIVNPIERELELLAIFEAIRSIAGDDYKTAKEKVTLVWDRLRKHDTWYLYDIRLINSILYLFPIDVAESIVNLALERLSYYKDLRDISQLSANIQINYILLLIKNKEYTPALQTTEELISYCIEHNLYKHLATCYVRKGILLSNLTQENPSEWYEKGFVLLNALDNKQLIQSLKKEIDFYTNI